MKCMLLWASGYSNEYGEFELWKIDEGEWEDIPDSDFYELKGFIETESFKSYLSSQWKERPILIRKPVKGEPTAKMKLTEYLEFKRKEKEKQDKKLKAEEEKKRKAKEKRELRQLEKLKQKFGQ